MPVFKYLDLSTAHITRLDSQLLNREKQPARVIPHDYGWWINVQWEESASSHVERIQAFTNFGYSESFLNVYRLARQLKCNWINLDQDAELEPHPELDTHEW